MRVLGELSIQASTQASVRSSTVNTGELDLNVLEIGDPNGLPVICVHGLRDTAHALIPSLTWEDSRFRFLLPELRGHGLSDQTDAFAMPNFLQDVLSVAEHFKLDKFALFGHSLGGHVTSKFAALWPERVTALVIVEGLGPPRRPHEGDPELELQAYRFMLENRLAYKAPKAMPNLDDAAKRLLRNNPRLNASEAERLVPFLTKPVNEGLVWSFDNRAASVFIGQTAIENQKFWNAVQAPTCVIAGTLSYEYWGREMQSTGFTGKFAEGEMEARAAHFKHHEFHWFDHSGHMVHYDEPERLSQVTRTFLEKQHV